MIRFHKNTFQFIGFIFLVFTTLVSCKKAVAPTVVTENITNITPYTAKVNIYVTNAGSAPVTATGVCWKTSANPSLSDSVLHAGSGTGPFSSTLSGLQPATVYHAKAFATNSVGTAYGDDLVFTTQN